MQSFSNIRYPKNRSEALRIIRAFDLAWSEIVREKSARVRNRRIAEIGKIINSMISSSEEKLGEAKSNIEKLERKKELAQLEDRILPDYNQKLIKFSIDAANAESVIYALGKWAKRHRISSRL